MLNMALSFRINLWRIILVTIIIIVAWLGAAIWV